MLRVIVSVRREGERRERDLEVPAEIEAQRLAMLIAHALRWPEVPYTIYAKIPRRRKVLEIKPFESLADAGAWDGTRLLFRATTAQAGYATPAASYSDGAPRAYAPSAPSPLPPSPPPAPPPSDAPPIRGWRSLGIELPGEEEDETGEEGPNPFPWREI